MNKKSDRRQFLKNASIGVFGAGLFGNIYFAPTVKHQKNVSSK